MAMSMAPWWCGIIIAAKSSSTLPLGWTDMPSIILVIATSFSAANRSASEPVAVPANERCGSGQRRLGSSTAPMAGGVGSR
jgi:hypothetical protein